jgi:hypothetical protein
MEPVLPAGKVLVQPGCAIGVAITCADVPVDPATIAANADAARTSPRDPARPVPKNLLIAKIPIAQYYEKLTLRGSESTSY